MRERGCGAYGIEGPRNLSLSGGEGKDFRSGKRAELCSVEYYDAYSETRARTEYDLVSSSQARHDPDAGGQEVIVIQQTNPAASG